MHRVRTDKNSTLAQIIQVFRQINGHKNYKSVTIDGGEAFLGHGTDNGGSLKGYYKGVKVKQLKSPA